jgi:hypothetical protein
MLGGRRHPENETDKYQHPAPCGHRDGDGRLEGVILTCLAKRLVARVALAQVRSREVQHALYGWRN